MQLLAQILALVFVVSTMLGVGMLLSLREISGSLHDRRWLARALLANFVMLPVLALAITRLLHLDPGLSAGLLILATAPGGPVLIRLVAMARKDPALSVGLLVTLLITSVLTQPLILPLLVQHVHISGKDIVLTLLFSVLLPLLLGLVLRARRPLLAEKWRTPVQKLSTLSMLLICIVLPAMYWQELLQIIGSLAFLAAALFLLLACAGGWLLGGPQQGPRRILSLNCMQPNLAVAVVIANQNFSDPKVVLMLLVILVSSIPLVLLLCRYYASHPQPAANS